MGITKRVRNVEKSKPDATAMAMGDLSSAPSVWLRAMGSMPRIVVMAVTNIGRTRTAAPSIMAS
jgi:hypothetical protein